MTSKPRECFVYITLPGQTEPITAARFEHTTDRHSVSLGRLVYGRSYLERPETIPIDPVELKLSDRTYETTRLNGVFGALRDAGPDYWGRRVIEKHAGKPQLHELDYLLESPDDRAGALGFGLNATPPAPKRRFNQTIDLEKLQRIADAIIADEPLPDDDDLAQVEDLMLIGTSMGGARPKAVVEDEDGLWIAKFNRDDDRWNNALVEHAMLQLGRHCGLTTSESKVVSVAGRSILLVKRFDREKTTAGYLRARMISALTLLQAGESPAERENWSYVRLAEELRRVSEDPARDAKELFRRICFNALISNTDDHPRNHAAIALGKDWRLAPAYDLTPTPQIAEDRRNLAMACGDWGNYANAQNILSQSARFLLKADEASRIVTDMETAIRGSWYDIARAAGVTEKDCQTISSAFNYPGFGYAP
jgi:serine/threonine-protein kinase HipA